MKRRIAVFASGSGSNFDAIVKAVLDNRLQVEIGYLVSDQPNSKVVEKAKLYGIETIVFDANKYESKEEYESIILKKLVDNRICLIVLAGYMRIIGATLLAQYRRRIINIHPSYLPAFRGLDAIGQALKANATCTGVTIHYVDEGIDTGDIIVQKQVIIDKDETRESLEVKIHALEHELYPETIKKIVEEINEESVN